MSRRSLAVSFAALVACAPARLVPIGNARGRSASSAVMQKDGITVVATANAWRFDEDLTQVATPLFLFVVDDGPLSLDVRYADFGLVDQSGRVYAPIPPAEVVRILYSSADATGPAVAGGGEGQSGRPDPPQGAPTPPEPPPGPMMRPGYGLAGAWGSWSGPWGWPWAWEWGPYPDDFVAYRGVHEILALGLRPGPLPAGARVQGFLYFQPAWKAQMLTLRFQATPQHGAPFAMQARFAVEH